MVNPVSVKSTVSAPCVPVAQTAAEGSRSVRLVRCSRFRADNSTAVGSAVCAKAAPVLSSLPWCAALRMSQGAAA